MSAGSDWIVIRGTGTKLDGTWVDRPFPWATRLPLGPGLAVVPTPGFEQDDEKGVGQVWEPEHRRPQIKRIILAIGIPYGGGPKPKTPPPQTLLGMPIVEVGPDHFPPLKTGDIVLGPPEDIGGMFLDDLCPPEDTGEPKKGPSEPQERPER